MDAIVVVPPAEPDAGRAMTPAGAATRWTLHTGDARCPIGEGESVEVGRSADDHAPDKLIVPDALVSRRHAAVTIEDGVPYVVDLGSGNGTWLFRDGEHVEVADQWVAAADGDVVMTLDGVVLVTIRSTTP